MQLSIRIHTGYCCDFIMIIIDNIIYEAGEKIRHIKIAAPNKSLEILKQAVNQSLPVSKKGIIICSPCGGQLK